MTLRITPKRVACLLLPVIVVVAILGSAVEYAHRALGHSRLLGFNRMLKLDGEANLPTWWSSLVLLGCAALLACIAAEQTSRGERDRRRWWILAAIFLGLSIDETAMIHDSVGRILGNAIAARMAAFGIPIEQSVFNWVIVAALFLAAFGAYFAGFFLRLPSRTRRFFGIAGTIYVGGAFGLEILGSREFIFRDFERTYVIVTLVEETLEMLGQMVFACGLVDHLSRLYDGPGILIRVGPERLGPVSTVDTAADDPLSAFDTDAEEADWDDPRVMLSR